MWYQLGCASMYHHKRCVWARDWLLPPPQARLHVHAYTCVCMHMPCASRIHMCKHVQAYTCANIHVSCLGLTMHHAPCLKQCTHLNRCCHDAAMSTHTSPLDSAAMPFSSTTSPGVFACALPRSLAYSRLPSLAHVHACLWSTRKRSLLRAWHALERAVARASN